MGLAVMLDLANPSLPRLVADRSLSESGAQNITPWQALIFDFDYTLADSSAGIVECTNSALGALGLPPAQATAICPLIGLTLPAMLVRLAGPQHQHLATEFTRWFVARADEVMVDLTQLYAVVPSAMTTLRGKGIKLGIVSTKFRRRIETILSRESLLSLFDVIVGGEDVAEHKPSPLGLLLALARLGCAPTRSLYVGDSVTDAQTAQRAGVPFVAVLSGVTPREAFAPYPHLHIMDSVGDLPNL